MPIEPAVIASSPWLGRQQCVVAADRGEQQVQRQADREAEEQQASQQRLQRIARLRQADLPGPCAEQEHAEDAQQLETDDAADPGEGVDLRIGVDHVRVAAVRVGVDDRAQSALDSGGATGAACAISA